MGCVIGLTGSIGMGKSTVAGMARRMGVPVWDADAAVHRLQGPGGALLAAIEARFPGTTGAGGVDRARLGEQVLGDRTALSALERIVHPAVARDRRAFLRRHRSHPVVMLDIPLLFETGGWRAVDLVVLVSAPAWKQRARVLARPGMTPARFAATLRRQMPDREKRRRADIVIDTGGTLARTRGEVRALIACARARPGRYCARCVKSCSIRKPPA